NKNIQHYLDSFKLGKHFATMFLIDLAALSIIIFAFLWFSSYTQQRSLQLLQGRTTAELQQMLLSLSPEQSLYFTTALKYLSLTFLLGFLLAVVCLISFFLYSRTKQQKSFKLSLLLTLSLGILLLITDLYFLNSYLGASKNLSPFFAGLLFFMLTSFLWLPLLAIGAFLLFSYSQARIWNYLQGKKVTKNNYWRWNLLNLSLLVPFLLFLATVLIVKIVTMILLNLPPKLMPLFYLNHSNLMENIRLVIDGAVLFYMVVLFMVIIFLIYSHFVKSYKVWDSIGAGFSIFNKNWKKVLLLVLFATASALLATVILLPIKKALLFYPLYSTIVNLVLAAFFLAWLRWYVFKTIVHGPQ
ncbi:MAG: hypothetical protein AABX31_02385, partial [Nanoarchaeota archaeon]